MDMIIPNPAWLMDYIDTPWINPIGFNLVAEVSWTTKKTFQVLKECTPVKGPDGKVLRIMAVDVGMKNIKIRCFVKRDVFVPWDYDFVADQDYDGLCMSNGPGDPTIVKVVIDRLAQIISKK